MQLPFRFACGGLDNEYHMIAEDRSSLSVASSLQTDVDARLRVLFDKIDEKNETHYLAKMAIIYTQCMNITAHEELGDEPLQFVLSEIGGWPVVEGPNWTSANNYSLEETLVHLKRLGYKLDLLAEIEVAPHVLAHRFNLISALVCTRPSQCYCRDGKVWKSDREHVCIPTSQCPP